MDFLTIFKIYFLMLSFIIIVTGSKPLLKTSNTNVSKINDANAVRGKRDFYYELPIRKDSDDIIYNPLHKSEMEEYKKYKEINKKRQKEIQTVLSQSLTTEQDNENLKILSKNESDKYLKTILDNILELKNLIINNTSL